jgi:hypothetical protein
VIDASTIFGTTATTSSLSSDNGVYDNCTGGTPPSVTLTSAGTKAQITISATMQPGNANFPGYLAPTISGATTLSASDANAWAIPGGSTSTTGGGSRTVWLTIDAGTNTYSLQCKNVTAGSADNWSNVQLTVIAP